MDTENDESQLAQDCWRRIGIWGKESNRCEKLKHVKHCRNCDVFESAAREAVLERHLSMGDDALTIEELIEKETREGDKSMMPFRLGNLCFALPSGAVLTIHDQVAVHSIPHNVSAVIKGLVAINHEVYTFIDLAKLLDLEPNQKDAGDTKLQSLFKRALVVDLAGRTVVFYVDEVYQIHRYFQKDMRLVDKKLPGADLMQGMLVNNQNWVGNCNLLDLATTSQLLGVRSK